MIVSGLTVGQRGGLALWTREELKRYPFLRLRLTVAKTGPEHMDN